MSPINFNMEAEILETWPLMMIGFGLSRKPGYLLYIAALELFYLYFLVATVIAIYHIMSDLNNVFAGLHIILSINWVTSTIMLRFITSRSINELSKMIKSGIYHYENEELDEAHLKILESVSKDLSRKKRFFFRMYFVSFPLTMFISPGIDYIFYQERNQSLADDFYNPFLPHNLYFPFDTRTTSGFLAAYFLQLVFWLHACMAAFNAIWFVVVTIAQLKLHLKILNYSVENIQSRAIAMYKRQWRSLESISFDKKEFDYCLLTCLKANIRHHQTLIRYRNVFKPYVGPSLFAIFSACVILLYAVLLYLLLQKQPISVRMKYISMFTVEHACTTFICLFGEDVIVESDILFEKLYETPWFRCGKDFKQTLHIMMTHTRNPIKYNAVFVKASSSLESYGELVKATYTLMNLIVPSTS